ncbi:MAG TPA: flippase-like domain-containing protein [Gemmatimonadaceae bacterium]|nr:flippase-like domain-containing protein [Gemmatimonadaceae bacterium]
MKRWLLTALSFAVVLAVSVYAVRSGAPHGVDLVIPLRAHLLALAAFVIEVVARSIKLTLSAKAVHSRLPLTTSVRTSLGGDFGASITPARVGSEPARFLILKEAGVPSSEAMVILYTELFLEALSLAAVVIGIALIFRASGKAFLAMIGVVGIYAMFVIGLGLLGYILSRREVADEAPGWAHRVRLHGKRWEIVQRWFGRVRTTVDAFRDMSLGWAVLSLLFSIVHVGIRFTVLPAIVYSTTTAAVPLAPLVVWPLGIIYGAGVVPAPGGGGAVELTFRAALHGVIPAATFAAALVWWRFYTFYIYIVLGGLIAGNTALRAVRETEEMEEELERGE